MKGLSLTVTENKPLNHDVYSLVLQGEGLEKSLPGQFVQIKLPNFYLRRPISICDMEMNKIRLVYKVLGKGTEYLSNIEKGELEIITGLGKGFSLEKIDKTPILIGGGVGLPPMYFLSKALLKIGIKPIIISGFNNVKDIFMKDDFEKLGLNMLIATMDGSYGFKGTSLAFLEDYIEKEGVHVGHVYACGPNGMLRALSSIMEKKDLRGQFSLEERMACGFGACMGCSIKTRSGMKRVCKDGPVFDANELLW